MRLTSISRGAFVGGVGGTLASLAIPSGAVFAAGTIKIGVDLPMSGGDAANGVPTANGVLLAIEEANKRTIAGGFKFEMSLLDDCVQGKHDPAAGAQNVKTFIADSAVLAMIGPFNSNVAKSEIPLTNDAVLAQISASTTNDGLTIGDDAKKLRVAHPDTNTFFRVCTRDSRQGSALATFAGKHGYKKVFIVDDNETYGKGLADNFESAFKADGGTVLGHEHLTPNQQDFKALLTKIKGTNPDVVFFGGNTVTGGGLLRRQMGDVGMTNTPYLGGDGLGDTENLVQQAGPMAHDIYYSVAAPDTEKLPTAKEFVAAYKARFKDPLGSYSANAYSATMIEIAAIEKAIKENGGKVPDRSVVLKNIAATRDFDSPIGKIGFDSNGDTTAGILTFWKLEANGKPVSVEQVVLK
jgi:branched-chain amino acid transport system substrate-binding protein